MQQQVKEAPIDDEAAQLRRTPATEATPRAREVVTRWRALAGMAVSVTLACVVVTIEFTSQAAHRVSLMHRHAEAMLSRVSRLESEIAAERARISAAHREVAAAETLRALLRAPDAGLLKLSPPAVLGGHKAAPAHRPEAMLALSAEEHRAVLIVAGLKAPAGDMPFVLWWSASHGAPVQAAEFRTAADGSALVTAAIPLGLEVKGATITAEPAAEGDPRKAAASSSAQAAPLGPVQLRGTLAR
jgi:hypothetical protein